MQPEPRPLTSNLPQVMARLVAGERTAVAEFFDLAAAPVRRLLLHGLQERDMWIDGERLDDITRDAIVELIRLAPSWRPDGGAAPWTWARLRLISLAFDRIGILAEDLDEFEHEESPMVTRTCDEPSAVSALELLEDEHTGARTLVAALHRTSSRRDRSVWLEVLSEGAAGNRAPSETVARSHDLTPANVRKICQRVREDLKNLARAEAEFEPLLALTPLAA